jgi:hypothetical protein
MINIFDLLFDKQRNFLHDAEFYYNSKRDEDNGREKFIGSQWYTEIQQLSIVRPIFRSVQGHNHTMFVIDVDAKLLKIEGLRFTQNELREIKARCVLQKFSDSRWNEFLMYLTGGGNLYLVQKYDTVIDPSLFRQVVNNLPMLKFCNRNHMPEDSKIGCGWHRDSVDMGIVSYERIAELPESICEFKIDFSMYKNGKTLFRTPYSLYLKLKRETYIGTPIVKSIDGTIDINETIKRTKVENSIDVDFTIPKFSFHQLIDEKNNDIKINSYKPNIKTTTKYLTVKNKEINLKIPNSLDELNEEQRGLLNKALQMVGEYGEIPEHVPPCIYNSYKQIYNRFWSRVVLVRYLFNKGIDEHTIATLIKFYINDETDNLPENKKGMEKGMKFALGSLENPNQMTTCIKLQDKSSTHYSCTTIDAAICGRLHPLHPYKKQTTIPLPIIEKDELIENKYSFDYIYNTMDKIIKEGKNVELIKATRAGATTATVIQSFKMKKKILVITPTNAINRKTFLRILEIAKERFDVTIQGGVISSNINSCLKLAIEALEVKKKWGTNAVYLKEAIHIKPSCYTINDEGNIVNPCKYLKSTFNNLSKINLPIIESDVERNLCAYTSIINNDHLSNFDVIFMTYNKLYTMTLEQNNKETSALTRIINWADIVFLDEVSHLVQKPANSYPLTENNIDEILMTEQSRLKEHFRTKPHKMKLLNEFWETLPIIFIEIRELINFITKIPSTQMIELSKHLLKPNELIVAYQQLLSEYMKETNKNIPTIIMLTTILSYQYYWIVAVNTSKHEKTISLHLPPIMEPIANALRRQPFKQIIATDATMPLLPLNDLLKIDLNKVILEDQMVAKKQLLIVTPLRNYNISNTPNYIVEEIRTYITNILSEHKNEEVVVVFSNSGYLYQIFHNDWENVQITYFRSDMTIGVENKRRVMIIVGKPNPPKGSFDWLAQYYQKVGIEHKKTNIIEQLEKTEAFQHFTQTIGRVKSPEGNENSIVYVWGVGLWFINDLLEYMDNNNRPNMIYFNKIDINNILMAGKIWNKFNLTITEQFINVYKYIQKIEHHVKINELFSKNIVDRKSHETLIKLEIEKMPTNLLAYLNIKLSNDQKNILYQYNNVIDI